MRDKLVYNPTLSVAENATNNGVSVAAIRKFIRTNGIDRKGDEVKRRFRAVRKLVKENPSITIREIALTLGISYNTARKYYNMDEVANVDTNKVSTFDTSKRDYVIKSVSDSQDEILSNIMRLYLNGKSHFDIDLCYSRGVFYRRIPQPVLKFDKYPQQEGVLPLNEAYNLPMGFYDSVVIDLTFHCQARQVYPHINGFTEIHVFSVRR